MAKERSSATFPMYLEARRAIGEDSDVDRISVTDLMTSLVEDCYLGVPREQADKWGVRRIEMLKRIVAHFGRQPELVQAMILGLIPPQLAEQAYQEMLKGVVKKKLTLS